MARHTNNGNGRFLVSQTREVANLTHGVQCANHDCREFDPNILVKYDRQWKCEKHGGFVVGNRKSNRDDDLSDSIPGSARRARIAAFRSAPKPEYSAAKQARIDAALSSRVGSHGCVNDRRKSISIKEAKKTKVSKAETARQQAMELLGLTEADIVAAQESK